MDNSEQLELTDEMIQRNDEIDNAVQQCICTLAEREIDWNMEIIGHVSDVIKETLAGLGIKVRHPAVVTELDGTQHYTE